MTNALSLRLIADQMEDSESYRTDEHGIEALCLRNAADEIERLRDALRPFVEPCIEHCHETCESEEECMEDCPCFKARTALEGKE